MGSNSVGGSFASRNGKPGATRGRKTSGLTEIAGLPSGVQNVAARLVQSIGAYRFLARYVCVRFGEQPDIAGI